jgi:hypothetical protein
MTAPNGGPKENLLNVSGVCTGFPAYRGKAY